MKQHLIDAVMVTLADCYSNREECARLLQMPAATLARHLLDETMRLAHQGGPSLDSQEAAEAVDVERDQALRAGYSWLMMTQPQRAKMLEAATMLKIATLEPDELERTILAEMPESPSARQALADHCRRNVERRAQVA
jgi:hypothetical protein